MNARLLMNAAACGFALCAGTAGAQDVPTLGDGPAKGKRLTKEQLRQCLEMQPQLKVQGDAAVRGRAELDASKSEFDQLDAELQRTRGSLDASDKAAVDAYNAQLARRKELVADYNAKLPTVNEQAERYNALQQSWKADCDDRPYSEADYSSLPAQRR